jgi:rRNA maturation endonuclease Nob1
MVALLRCPTCRTSITQPLDGNEHRCPRCGHRMHLEGISRGVIRAESVLEDVRSR